jgi:DNA-directed RNA polymerase subunit N (RpoN/RPB10)
MESAGDADHIWVTCMKCNRSYQMSWTQYGTELEEKSKADPEAEPWDVPVRCQKCGQEAVMRAHQCEQCSVVFPLGSLPKDFLDRCPQCRYSKTEAIRKARSI